MTKTKILKRRGSANLAPRDPKKETLCRQLCSILEQSGIEVRREELKRGHGWHAVSGHCELREQPILFVDRRLSQDDQISFLVDKILGFGITPQSEILAALPRNMQATLVRDRSVRDHGSFATPDEKQ